MPIWPLPQKLVDDINHERAGIRKSGANFEEIVHLLKTGTDPASIQHDIESAVEQFRADIAKANEALDDLRALKTIAKEALGLSADGKPLEHASPHLLIPPPGADAGAGGFAPTTAKTAVSPRQRDFKTQPLKSPSRLPLHGYPLAIR